LLRPGFATTLTWCLAVQIVKLGDVVDERDESAREVTDWNIFCRSSW
jgi:hypothetical protein